jgi:acyl-CoA synthetase (AMP-forming)/AMP-acid ligase II
VARDGAEVADTELDAWCRGRLSGYKRPRQFFVVDDLGRSAAGKADYRRLRALASDLAASRG